MSWTSRFFSFPSLQFADGRSAVTPTLFAKGLWTYRVNFLIQSILVDDEAAWAEIPTRRSN